MKEINKKQETIPDAYEDMIRSEKLDPYETQIKSNDFLKTKNKF